MPPRCQALLDNHTQCQNAAWGVINETEFCRLHFSYALAKTADAASFTLTVLNPNDKPDLENMLKQRIEAQKEAEVALEEAKLQQ